MTRRRVIISYPAAFVKGGGHSLKTVMVDGVETKLESDMFAATKQA